MCEFIRKRIIRKVSSKTPTGFLPLSQIRAMMVLMDANGYKKDECLDHVRKFCRKNSIELTVMYVDFNSFKGDEDTIALGDIDLTGKPSMKKAGYVLGKWFDLMVCMTESDKFCIRYLSHAIDARMKVGMKAMPEDPYEIVVTPSSDAQPRTSDQPDASVAMTDVFSTLENILVKIR